MGPFGAKLALLGPRSAEMGAKVGQDGPKMEPRWAKMGPRCGQDGAKMGQDEAKMRPRWGPRWQLCC